MHRQTCVSLRRGSRHSVLRGVVEGDGCCPEPFTWPASGRKRKSLEMVDDRLDQ
jgi:hypothetical protein